MRLYDDKQAQELLESYKREQTKELRQFLVEEGNSIELDNTTLNTLVKAIKDGDDYKIKWCVRRAFSLGKTKVISKMYNKL